MSRTLDIETPASGTALLRFNRPQCLNALNETLVKELRQAFAAIADDPAVRVVVLTGAGRGFCAGLDLRDFGPSMPHVEAPAIEQMRFQEMMASLPGLMRDLPQPIIAAVNGPTFGAGFGLCLAADIRVCARSAFFGNGAIKIGLSGADMGMSYHLPRMVGTSMAADWMLTGRRIPADEAFRCGLVSAILDDEQLLPHALSMAAEIAAHSPLASQMTKRALQISVDAPNFSTAVEVENRNQLITHATEEAALARAAWRKAQ
jgi:enoyl-CoA hydratase/carnithine racemase